MSCFLLRSSTLYVPVYTYLYLYIQPTVLTPGATQRKPPAFPSWQLGVRPKGGSSEEDREAAHFDTGASPSAATIYVQDVSMADSYPYKGG